jgi:hypothetical protein
VTPLARNTKIAALVVAAVAALAISLAVVLPSGATTDLTGPPSAAGDVAALASTPAVAHVPDAVVRAEGYLPDRAQAGSARSDQVHRLMTGAGVNGVDLYAFPTDKGAVCLVVTEAASPGICAERFDHNAPIAFGVYSGVDAPTTLVGIVPDSVVRVDVVWQGVAHRVRLSNNVIFFQSSDPALADQDAPLNGIQALVIHYRGGATLTRKFGTPSSQ